ncbi:MAG TPA: hypothetical protein VJK52_03465 [Candidatus Nanoarchaeia archaeon]|nr:hypothetical protein [Candidatus Nanoarchaeia archaeon]
MKGLAQILLQNLIILLFVITVGQAVFLLRLTDQVLDLKADNSVLGQVVGTVSFTVISCGDSVVEPGEDCDGNDLNGSTCTSEGFSSGTIACLSNCSFNTSQCTGEQEVAQVPGGGDGGGERGYREPPIEELPSPIRKPAPFDISVQVRDSLIAAGESVEGHIIIIPREAQTTLSYAQIYYAIVDRDFRILAEDGDTLPFRLSGTLDAALIVPSDTIPGEYRFFARANLKEEKAEASVPFTVTEKTSARAAPISQVPQTVSRRKNPLIIISVFVLSLILLIVLHHIYLLRKGKVQ